eukprot:372867_1
MLTHNPIECQIVYQNTENDSDTDSEQIILNKNEYQSKFGYFDFRNALQNWKYYIGYAKKTWYGFSKISICWIVLHIANCLLTCVMFYNHPPNPKNPWCIVHEQNFILLQFQSFILFACALYNMKKQSFSTDLNFATEYMQPVRYNIDQTHMKANSGICLRLKYFKGKMLHNFVNIFAWTTIFIVSLSEFIEAVDPNGWKFGPYGCPLEIVLWIFDTCRFIQCVVVCFFIHACLDPFKSEFMSFVESNISNSAVELDGPITIVSVNMDGFKKNYYKMANPFKQFVYTWQVFLVLYGLLNGVSVILICSAIIKNYLGIGCNLAASYFVHITLETSFQFLYGLLLAFKLNRNHHVISDYQQKFVQYVTIQNQSENAFILIDRFFTNELKYGQFAVCGKISDSMKIMTRTDHAVVSCD